VRISVSLPDEMMEDLKEKANTEGARSIASVIRQAVDSYLEKGETK